MMKYRYLFFLFCLILQFMACAHSKPQIHKSSGLLQSASVEMGTGTTLYNRGCYHQALPHFFKAHEIYSGIDQLDGTAMSLNNIGNVYRALNNPESAVLFFDEAFHIYTEINNTSGAIQTLSNKSAALITANRLNEAEKILLKAESMAAGNTTDLKSLMHNRSILLIKQKKYADAQQSLLDNLKKTDNDSYSELAAINFALGSVMAETNRYESAISFYLKALTFDRKTGFHKRIADDLEAIGKCYIVLNNNKKGVQYLKRSVKIYALMKDEEKVVEIMEQLDAAAVNTDINTTILKAFINDWLSGNMERSLCE